MLSPSLGEYHSFLFVRNFMALCLLGSLPSERIGAWSRRCSKAIDDLAVGSDVGRVCNSCQAFHAIFLLLISLSSVYVEMLSRKACWLFPPTFKKHPSFH